MATGDQADFLRRIKAVLPARWMPDVSPILDGVLSGAASAFASSYALLAYTKAQARRLTASGIWLDMASGDFFATHLMRRTNETDSSLSQRIGLEMFREKGTRDGMIRALTDLTGNVPSVFEPALTTDTGGYTVGGIGYGVAGGYGSLLLPFQFFLTAYRPRNGGVSNVGGYYAGTGWAGGGYGVGALEYISASMIAAYISDAEILATINDVRPAAYTAWVNISG